MDKQPFVKIFAHKDIEGLLKHEAWSHFGEHYVPDQCKMVYAEYASTTAAPRKFTQHEPRYNRYGTEYLALVSGNAKVNGVPLTHGSIVRIDVGEIVQIETKGNAKLVSYFTPYHKPLVHNTFEAPSVRKADKKYGKIVSIVMIAKDIQYHVCHAIMSCIRQTYPNLQIIIVEDSSKDSTLEKCMSMATFDSRIEVYSQKLGANGARRFGMEKAIGDYCLMVDGDDWLTHDAIERLVSAAEHNDSECVMFGYDHYNDKNRIFHNPIFPSGKSIDAAPIWSARTIAEAQKASRLNHTVWVLFFSLKLKDVVLKSLISLDKYEDLPLLIVLFQNARNPIIYNFILYHYRRERAGQITEQWAAVHPTQKQACLLLAAKQSIESIDPSNWFCQLILLYKIEQIFDYEWNLCNHHKDYTACRAWEQTWCRLATYFPRNFEEKLLHPRTKLNFGRAFQKL